VIFFVQDIVAQLKELEKQRAFDSLVILSDQNTYPLLPGAFETLETKHFHIIIPAGEQHKNLSTAQFIWEEMKKGGASRKSWMVNIGGGTLSDLGGFCAATYMRGISTINIPTTLLSMVDAAVGGKNGINLGGIKNLVGTFHEPEQVWLHPEFLYTLPEEELQNGWGEVIKHGIIAGGELWELSRAVIPPIKETQIWSRLILLNIELKKQIVQEDPRESGKRKILNLGHTVAHALESVFMSHGEYISHGHAVAIGMVIESIAGELASITPTATAQAIIETVAKTFPLIPIARNWEPAFFQAMTSDKKTVAGELQFALPISIGQVIPDQVLSREHIIRAFEIYNKNAAKI